MTITPEEINQCDLHCLGCGHDLIKTGTENLCAKCLLNYDFGTKDIIIENINEKIKAILDHFTSDVRSAFEKDPAATSLVEVLTSYPGIKAVLLHRIAHFFYKIGIWYLVVQSHDYILYIFPIVLKQIQLPSRQTDLIHFLSIQY